MLAITGERRVGKDSASTKVFPLLIGARRSDADRACGYQWVGLPGGTSPASQPALYRSVFPTGEITVEGTALSAMFASRVVVWRVTMVGQLGWHEEYGVARHDHVGRPLQLAVGFLAAEGDHVIEAQFDSVCSALGPIYRDFTLCQVEWNPPVLPPLEIVGGGTPLRILTRPEIHIEKAREVTPVPPRGEPQVPVSQTAASLPTLSAGATPHVEFCCVRKFALPADVSAPQALVVLPHRRTLYLQDSREKMFRLRLCLPEPAAEPLDGPPGSLPIVPLTNGKQFASFHSTGVLTWHEKGEKIVTAHSAAPADLAPMRHMQPALYRLLTASSCQIAIWKQKGLHWDQFEHVDVLGLPYILDGIAGHPGGACFVTADRDGAVRFHGGGPNSISPAGVGRVERLAVSPCGNFAFAGGEACVILERSGGVSNIGAAASRLVWAGFLDQKIAGEAALALVRKDGVVQLRSVSSRRAIGAFDLHQGGITAATFDLETRSMFCAGRNWVEQWQMTKPPSWIKRTRLGWF